MILPVPVPPERPRPSLPPGFVLGTGTSAYQVEGAGSASADGGASGRGPSVWDAFSAQPGHIYDDSDAVVAADHYHRLEDDLLLLKRLGVGGYRFSFSWPRIQPTGLGPARPDALDFYDRMLDGVLAAGARPCATLFHWDLPQHLQDDGGWLNRATIEAFVEYAALVGERFADRVAHWVPIEQPAMVAFLGHAVGLHAPGMRLGLDSVHVAHHLLLAHGRAVGALRSAGATSVGCSNQHAPVWPASEDAADVGASKLFDAMWNGMFLETMLLGHYPADLAPLMDDVLEPGDAADLRAPLDFYGVAYNGPIKVAATDDDADLPFELRETLGHPLTAARAPVVPEALREWLITVRARFRAALPPMVVTECGAAFDDVVGPDGEVVDDDRIDFLAEHLEAVAEAVRRGVDVRGFYAWSLLDSFEWLGGLSRRCGLVRVDPVTLERTPKASFDWYAGLVAAQPHHAG